MITIIGSWFKNRIKRSQYRDRPSSKRRFFFFGVSDLNRTAPIYMSRASKRVLEIFVEATKREEVLYGFDEV